MSVTRDWEQCCLKNKKMDQLKLGMRVVLTSSMKLELLCLRQAVTKKFRNLLIDAKTTVYTDNNPLSYLLPASRLGAIETRWAAELAQFELTIKFKSGKNDPNAEALSRKTQHPTDLQNIRFEQVHANEQDVVVSTYLSTELRSQILKNCKPWMEEIQIRSRLTEPVLVTSTFPSISAIEMAGLQTDDPCLKVVFPFVHSLG